MASAKQIHLSYKVQIELKDGGIDKMQTEQTINSLIILINSLKSGISQYIQFQYDARVDSGNTQKEQKIDEAKSIKTRNLNF